MFGKKKLTKSIAVYISDKFQHLIIAPHHENDAGIIYEQKVCFVSDYPITSEELGNEIIRNLNIYSIKDVNLRDSKQSDWPAYKHGKSKSITKFEKDYINIFIRSANDSNLVLTVEGSPFKDSELKVSSAISFHADKDEIGNRIKAIYDASLSGKIF
mgnify:CR=1 FL=1